MTGSELGGTGPGEVYSKRVMCPSMATETTSIEGDSHPTEGNSIATRCQLLPSKRRRTGPVRSESQSKDCHFQLGVMKGVIRLIQRNFRPVECHVIANQTYYFVATLVDSSGNEAAYSIQVSATIPTA